ncbi:MAG: hypothetical protein RLZZ488_1410 [Pseudomonadota bacterium]|jgi:hypothetical protein
MRIAFWGADSTQGDYNMKTFRSLQISLASVIFAVGIAACGSQQTSSQTSSADTLGQVNSSSLSPTFAIKCSANGGAEKQLARELSLRCRQDNAERKARGLASCGEDYCSEGVELESELRGLDVEFAYDGGEVEFLVTIASNFALPEKNKQALVCYAPVIKARELLTSAGSNCP